MDVGGIGHDARRTVRDSLMKWTRSLAIGVAELFLVLIVAIYMAKLGLLAMGMVSEYGHHRMSLIFFVIDSMMAIFAADAALNLFSCKPKAWRKVVRSAGLLAILNTVSYFGYYNTASGIVSINPALIVPLAAMVIVLMFLKTVRDYYVPPMEVDRPLRSWLGYVFFSPLYSSRSYSIDYGDE